MMRVFSSRLQWDSQPNPLSILLAQKRRSGAAILDLTESNPTRAGARLPGAGNCGCGSRHDSRGLFYTIRTLVVC